MVTLPTIFAPAQIVTPFPTNGLSEGVNPMSGRREPRVTPCMIVQFSPMASAPITVPTVCGRNNPPPMRTLGETSMPKQSRLSAAKNFANNRSGRRPYVISARRSRTTGAMRGLRKPAKQAEKDTVADPLHMRQ